MIFTLSPSVPVPSRVKLIDWEHLHVPPINFTIETYKKYKLPADALAFEESHNGGRINNKSSKR